MSAPDHGIECTKEVATPRQQNEGIIHAIVDRLDLAPRQKIELGGVGCCKRDGALPAQVVLRDEHEGVRLRAYAMCFELIDAATNALKLAAHDAGSVARHDPVRPVHEEQLRSSCGTRAQLPDVSVTNRSTRLPRSSSGRITLWTSD